MATRDEILRAMVDGDEMSTAEIERKLGNRLGGKRSGFVAYQLRFMQSKGLVKRRGDTEGDNTGHRHHVYQITRAGSEYLSAPRRQGAQA